MCPKTSAPQELCLPDWGGGSTQGVHHYPYNQNTAALKKAVTRSSTGAGIVAASHTTLMGTAISHFLLLPKEGLVLIPLSTPHPLASIMLAVFISKTLQQGIFADEEQWEMCPPPRKKVPVVLLASRSC